MKVNNTTICVGREERSIHQKKEQAKSFFAGTLNQQDDPIFLKKQRAKQKAMKIVGDTFASEQKLDEMQDTRREKVKELTQQLHEIEEYIAAQKEMPEEEMTAEMKAAQKEAIFEYEKQYQAVKSEIKAELITIEASKIERLKSSPMEDAQEAADKVMEAAAEEIVDMLFREAKEHIDEEQEEREEQAEKIAEKKEEEEERIAKAEEEQKETEAMRDAIKQSVTNDAQKEIEEMLNKLKLLEEDIKGAAVDETL